MKKYLFILISILIIPFYTKAAYYVTGYSGQGSASYTQYYFGFGERITITGVSGGNGSVSSSNSFYSASFRYNGSGCGSTSFSVRLSNGTSKNISVSYKTDWTSHIKGSWYRESIPSRSTRTANVAYEGCTLVQTSPKKIWHCTDVYTRCDGAPGSSSGASYACYRKVIDSTTGVSDYKWAASSPGTGYSKVSSIKSKDDCEIKNPNFCTPTNTQPEIEKNANKCDDSLNFNVRDSNKCMVASSTDFYNITCSDNIQVNYLPGFSGDTITLKKGQGFNYNIDLSLVKVCTGVFNEKAWTESYDRVISLINRSQNNIEKSYYQKQLDSINAFVNTYNDWKIENNDSANVKISFNYTENGKAKTFDSNFALFDSSSTVQNKTTSNCKTLKNGKKICDFSNYKISTNKNFVPPEVKFDISTGELTVSNNNTINAGNKFYTSLKSDTGVYTIKISITDIGGNSKVSAFNEKCKIKIIGEEIEYRPIDVTNPFINNTRTIARNWANSSFNFVDVIKANTWSLNSLNSIDITSEDMTKIKESNALTGQVANSYLGTCQKSLNNDDIVCSLIKEKK